MFDQNDPHQDLPEQMFAPLRGRNAPGCVAGSWKFGAGQRRQACPATIKKKKKKKKILPLLLYHVLLPKVKSFLKNFLKKFSRFLLTFASGYDIIEERV